MKLSDAEVGCDYRTDMVDRFRVLEKRKNGEVVLFRAGEDKTVVIPKEQADIQEIFKI